MQGAGLELTAAELVCTCRDDQPGGFPLAAISYLLLNTQVQGPASGCGRTLTDVCEDEEELNGGVGAGAAG